MRIIVLVLYLTYSFLSISKSSVHTVYFFKKSGGLICRPTSNAPGLLKMKSIVCKVIKEIRMKKYSISIIIGGDKRARKYYLIGN